MVLSIPSFIGKSWKHQPTALPHLVSWVTKALPACLEKENKTQPMLPAGRDLTSGVRGTPGTQLEGALGANRKL